MRNRFWMVLVTGMVGPSVIAGCGGSDQIPSAEGGASTDDGSLPAFQSTIAAGTPLDQLTPTQNMELCKEVMNYNAMISTSAAYKATICEEGATGGLAITSKLSPTPMTDAQLMARCEQAVEACLARPTIEPPKGNAAGCAAATTFPGDCTATVGQEAACLNESLAEMRKLFGTCADLTNARAATLADSLMPDADARFNPLSGPACMALIAACPEVGLPSMP